MPSFPFSRSGTSVLIITMVFFVAPAIGDTDRAPRAVHSLEAIRATVVESHQRLKSLRIRYTVDLVDGEGPERKGSTLHRTVAIEAGQRLTDTWHATQLFPAQLDINHVVCFYGNLRVTELKPEQGYCETSSRATNPSVLSARCEYILECLGWWPPGDTPTTPFSASRFFLHEALTDPQCRVLPTQEAIDGAWCHVVERPGVERLWFDAATGCSLRRRSKYHGNPAVRNAEYQLSDYREVAPGLWFPWRLRRVLYKTRATPTGQPEQIASDSTAVVSSIAINRDLSADLTFTIPPGTYVVDFDTGESRKLPGGDLSQFDRLIELASKRGAVYTKLGLAAGWPSFEASRQTYGLWSSAGVFILSLSAVGVTFFWVRRINERRPLGQGAISAGSPEHDVAPAITPGVLHQ